MTLALTPEESAARHRRGSAEVRAMRRISSLRSCICGYLAASEDALVDHISYMVTVVGESNAKHRERR